MVVWLICLHTKHILVVAVEYVIIDSSNLSRLSDIYYFSGQDSMPDTENKTNQVCVVQLVHFSLLFFFSVLISLLINLFMKYLSICTISRDDKSKETDSHKEDINADSQSHEVEIKSEESNGTIAKSEESYSGRDSSSTSLPQEHEKRPVSMVAIFVCHRQLFFPFFSSY